jgi:alkyl hydroperoxide reductase subunit AhpC
MSLNRTILNLIRYDRRDLVCRWILECANLLVTKLAARHTFLINPEGVIVREFLDVNPSKHSQEVLTALTQLQQSGAAK